MAGNNKKKSYVPVAKIKNNLRKLHMHCPQKRIAKNRSKIDIATFKCENPSCDKAYYEGKSQERYEAIRDNWKIENIIVERGKIELDHIEPVVNIKKGFGSWDDYISGLWCGADDYQNLCTECHSEKSNDEMNQRAKSGSLRRKK